MHHPALGFLILIIQTMETLPRLAQSAFVVLLYVVVYLTLYPADLHPRRHYMNKKKD